MGDLKGWIWENMSIPNFLSLFRLVLVPITVIFLIDGSFLVALATFTLAGLTDCPGWFFGTCAESENDPRIHIDP